MNYNAYHVMSHKDGNYSLITPNGSTMDVSSVWETLQSKCDELNEELEALGKYRIFIENSMRYMYDTQKYIFWSKQLHAVTQSIYNRNELTCNSEMEK